MENKMNIKDVYWKCKRTFRKHKETISRVISYTLIASINACFFLFFFLSLLLSLFIYFSLYSCFLLIWCFCENFRCSFFRTFHRKSTKTAPHQLTGTPQGYSSVSFAGEAICRLYCRVLFLMHKWNFFFFAWCYFHFNSATMLKNSHFFEDRQAVSEAFCFWCNSVLNSLKSVRGKGFVQSGGLKQVTHKVICEKGCNFLTCLQL